MATFPHGMRFRGTWRPYQARVLAELDDHLDDDRLHLVAAPGSGKTVVGLEVVRRIDEPTLVVAPTLTVRDQWIDRLDMFLDGRPDWVSTDLEDPEDLTVVTYQALHEAMPDDQAALIGAGFGTIVLDEAHHLRRSWWDSLMAARQALDRPRIVALTATPPYDVPDEEWDNYVELCGPVDAEISTPELVREGNLCPHQDLVHVCAPTPDETTEIGRFRMTVDDLETELLEDEQFVAAIARHPWARSPDDHLDAIRDRPEQAAALAIYLSETRFWPPWRLLKTLGVPRRRLPALDRRWLEHLLTLITSADPPIPRFDVRSWRQRLADVGARPGSRVHLRSPPWLEQTLRSSPGKLDAIASIVRTEADALGDDLRLVALTDFIRADHVPEPSGDGDLEAIGAVPLFERLRRDDPGVAVGVLTGSLVIVPAAAEPALRAAAERRAGAGDALTFEPLDRDPEHVEMTAPGRVPTVQVVTDAFQEGRIRVLVGTAALLGEGWDAPATNSLVLASDVGSSMLSNQMRGRAIRTDPDDPTKTANIWHLATVETGRPEPGPDLETLRRRFRTFVGPDRDGRIRNGLDRIGLPDPPWSKADVESVKDRDHARARDRDEVRRTWDRAVATGDEIVETVEVPDERLPRGPALLAGLALLAVILPLAAGAVWWAIRPPAPPLPLVRTNLYPAIPALALLAAVGLGRRPLIRFVRHRTRAASLATVVDCVADALEAVDEIDDPEREVDVSARDGRVVCTVRGVTTQTRSKILDALQDVLDPVRDARYLLRRQPRPAWLRRPRYRAVPEALDGHRDRAEVFHERWQRSVAAVDLVYTRRGDGRLELLRARVRDLVEATPEVDRFKLWTEVPDHPLRDAIDRLTGTAEKR